MDKYYVYRPLLDLAGFTEGTDKRDGYNETLGYGIMLDGKVSGSARPRIILTDKTLDEIDAIQTKMLQDPDNKKLNSSAIGRYQIVRTTMREMRKKLKKDGRLVQGTDKFDEDMQDRMACYLLGLRGIDKYLAGRLHEDTLIDNLAKEWASFPTSREGGAYKGQNTPIKTQRMRDTLAEVKRRHREGQPVTEVVPVKVDKDVKKNFNLLQWIAGLFGGSGFGIAALAGFDWKALLVIFLFGSAAIGLLIFFRTRIIQEIKELREGLAE